MFFLANKIFLLMNALHHHETIIIITSRDDEYDDDDDLLSIYVDDRKRGKSPARVQVLLTNSIVLRSIFRGSAVPKVRASFAQIGNVEKLKQLLEKDWRDGQTPSTLN